MEITWDYGRVWHSDCSTRGGGIMVTEKKEQDRTLFKCLMCEKQGYYPHGRSGTVCTDEVDNAQGNTPASINDDKEEKHDD